MGTLWGGGGGGALSPPLFVVLWSSWKVPSGNFVVQWFLVWQIPYREMLSLGLKVSIRRGSRLPCLCCVVYEGSSRLAVGPYRPWLDGEFLLDVTSWAALRLSLLTDCWTILIRLCSGPPASGPVVSFSWVFLLVGCCLFRVWGFPPPVNVVNRANQMDRFCMPIRSFYCKTNIVILTCPSDMFPPVLPTFAFSWRIENWRCMGVVPRLPACRCQTYVTGSRVFPLIEWEKCLMCVSGS